MKKQRRNDGTFPTKKEEGEEGSGKQIPRGRPPRGARGKVARTALVVADGDR